MSLGDATERVVDVTGISGVCWVQPSPLLLWSGWGTTKRETITQPRPSRAFVHYISKNRIPDKIKGTCTLWRDSLAARPSGAIAENPMGLFAGEL